MSSRRVSLVPLLVAIVSGIVPLAGLWPGNTGAQVAGSPALPAEFDVMDSAHADRFVARIRIGSTGLIAIERADPERREWFAGIAAEMNEQRTIILPAPPPSSAPRFSMYGFPIGRDDPKFLTAMQQYLQRYHSLELR